MQKIILKIYIKHRKLPIATINVESEDILLKLTEELNDEKTTTIKLGQLIFAKSEFRYATIFYK